jgi:predicted RNA-binding Zn ribbon-like protein
VQPINQLPGRDRAPNPDLKLLEAFVNTNDLEEERDEIGSTERLHDWLVAVGAIGEREVVSSLAHGRALDVREGLRALGRVNNGEPLEAQRVERLNAAAADLPLLAGVPDSEHWQLRPASGGVDGFLSGLLAAMVRAMSDGSWSRVKACRNDTCRWLFFDQSRNRSGTWCSMAICGSRMKSRTYRARRRPSAAPAG